MSAIEALVVSSLVVGSWGCASELGAEMGYSKERRGTQALPGAVSRDQDQPADGAGSTGPTPDIPTTTCAELGYAGRCFGDVARWCNEQGELLQRDCAAMGEECGWIDADVGYYCAPLGAAPAPGPGPGGPTDGSQEPEGNWWWEDLLDPNNQGQGGPTGSAGNTSDLQQYCVDVINDFRASRFLPPLRRSAELENFAAEGARYNASAGPHAYFSMMGGGLAFAENEIPGWNANGSIQSVIQQGTQMMFNEGPGGGHYENIVGNYGSVGCGIHEQWGQVWVVQDFGR